VPKVSNILDHTIQLTHVWINDLDGREA
jgi:hypothetical protein